MPPPENTPFASIEPSPTSRPESTPVVSIQSTETLESLTCLPAPIEIAQARESHIGWRTPPELNGIKSLDELLIQSGDEYSIAVMQMLEGQDQYLFWLERFCDNKNGQRFTEVIDEIILPPLKENEFALVTCQLENKADSYVVATGYSRYETISGLTYKKVIATRAWSINPNEWIFVEIPAEKLHDVSCIREHT